MERIGTHPDNIQDKLYLYATSIFETFGLLEEFQIPYKTLHRFFQELRSHYRQNPYHNFYHAVDVLQTTALLLWAGAARYLKSIETLGLLVAALCHDVEHPGLRYVILSLFQTMTATPS